MIINENEVYTPEETQKLLKISDSTFRRLIKKQVLWAAKVGGQYRILGRDILRLLSPSFPSKVKKIYHNVMQKLDEEK